MPLALDDRILEGARSPNYMKLDELIRDREKEYQSKGKELEQLPTEDYVQQNSACVDKDLEMLATKTKELQTALFAIKAGQSDICEEYLQYTVVYYGQEKQNLLPIFNYPPGMWHFYQTKLDEICLQNGVRLAPCRFDVEYEKIGVFEDNLIKNWLREESARKAAEEAAIPLRDKRNILVEYNNAGGVRESHTTIFNGLNEKVDETWQVNCGPRYCGKLAPDERSCDHEPRKLEFKTRPTEWQELGGFWLNDNQFEVGHEPPWQGPAWEPYYDFDEKKTWKLMRAIGDGLDV